MIESLPEGCPNLFGDVGRELATGNQGFQRLRVTLLQIEWQRFIANRARLAAFELGPAFSKRKPRLLYVSFHSAPPRTYLNGGVD
jgi:hypothetical protein